jgi:DNA-binding XRE family transcriptional regulator
VPYDFSFVFIPYIIHIYCVNKFDVKNQCTCKKQQFLKYVLTAYPKSSYQELLVQICITGLLNMPLVTFLLEKGYTQQEFAALLGVHQSAVSKWLQGDSRPSWNIIAKIKQITDGKVTADSFLELPTYTEADE